MDVRKRFACTLCTKSFTWQYRVNFHIRNTHARLQVDTVCATCNRRFATTYGMLTCLFLAYVVAKAPIACGTHCIHLEPGMGVSYVEIGKSMSQTRETRIFFFLNLEKSGLPRSRALVTSCVKCCVMCQGVVLADKLWKE